MKLSSLIAVLTKLRAEHGDTEVDIYVENSAWGSNYSISTIEFDEAGFVMISVSP